MPIPFGTGVERCAARIYSQVRVCLLRKEFSMRTILAVLVITATAFALGKVVTNDIVFTYDGLEYTLQEDGRWTCKGEGCPKPNHDPFTIEVDFGEAKTVVFESDGYWHYKQPGELIGYGDITVKSVNVFAASTNPQIDLAEQVAVKNVYPKVYPKVLAGTRKRKLTAEKIRWCLDDMRVRPDIVRKQLPKGGWEVTATIKLDYQQILTIVRCGEQLVEAGAAEGAQADVTQE
jgi:hypothetical protein